jgi:hypothetical protein
VQSKMLVMLLGDCDFQLSMLLITTKPGMQQLKSWKDDEVRAAFRG